MSMKNDLGGKKNSIRNRTKITKFSEDKGWLTFKNVAARVPVVVCLLSCFQVEKDVCDLMIKSLKYCDTETDNARLPTCQYRAAIIHHRLASLYHNSYRNQVSERQP